MYRYAPLFETLKKKNKSQFFLIKNGVDPTTMQKIRHDRNVEVKSLDKICSILDCSFEEIVEHLPDKK